MSKQPKAIPKFASEAEERVFWETHDSPEYLDWSKAPKAVLPNLKPTTKTISLRLPQHLLDSLKAAANARDVPYQSLIKVWQHEKLLSHGTSVELQFMWSPAGACGQERELDGRSHYSRFAPAFRH